MHIIKEGFLNQPEELHQYLVEHLSSRLTYGGYKIAQRANEWAIELQVLRIWTKLEVVKRGARCWASLAMWPTWASDCFMLWSALIRISQSPSSITMSKPSSRANSSTLLVAKSSTSRIVEGSGSYWVKEAITIPMLSRMITPMPAHYSCGKVLRQNIF